MITLVDHTKNGHQLTLRESKEFQQKHQNDREVVLTHGGVRESVGSMCSEEE